MKTKSIIRILSALSFVLLSSCEDEQIVRDEDLGGKLSFGIVKVGDVDGRRANGNAVKQVSVEELSDVNADGNKLYVHMQDAVWAEIEKVDPKEAEKSVRAIYTRTETLKNMSVTGYSWKTGEAATAIPDVMYDKELTKSKAWSSDVFWPSKGKSSQYYAYSPYQCSGVLLNERENLRGGLEFVYTVPSDFDSQQDLLVAKSDVQQNEERLDKKVDFSFQHALAGIRLKINKHAMRKVKITKVSLQNVYGTALYTVGGDNSTSEKVGKWSAHANKTTFELTPQDGIVSNGNAGEFLIGGEKGSSTEKYTFMMIPQTLPQDAKMVVEYQDDLGLSHVLTAPIGKFKNNVWEQNHTETYLISDKSISYVPTFSVEIEENGSWITLNEQLLSDYQGKNVKYRVKSFIEVAQSGQPTQYKPIPWSVSFDENHEKPHWLEGIELQGEGTSEVGIEGTLHIHQQKAETASSHDLVLRNASEKKKLYNLSGDNGNLEIKNTANCYVVNSAGRYWFPLVYGNAVKNGKVNEKAYKTGNANGLSTFLNYKDNPITSPYIRLDLGYNRCDADQVFDVKLAWEDRNSLNREPASNVVIQDLKINGDGIEFTIPKDKIRQENALIVCMLKNNNQVVWSWHIWVTDQKLGENDVKHSYDGHDYEFMPVNLGWCYSNGAYYAARKSRLLFSQHASSIDSKFENLSVQTEILQNEFFDKVGGNSCLYQAGRKDPNIGALDNNVQKQYSYYYRWYISEYNRESFENITKADNTTIGKSINNPTLFYNSSKSNTNSIWVTKQDDALYWAYYGNMWDGKLTGNFTQQYNIQKTIYDPSPIGYTVAPYQSFEGIQRVGVKGHGVQYQLSSGDRIYLPFTGSRWGSDGTYHLRWNDKTEASFIWTAAPVSEMKQALVQNQYCFKFSSESEQLDAKWWDAANGVAIRCTKEK